LCFQRSFSLVAHPIPRQNNTGTRVIRPSSILQMLKAFINSIPDIKSAASLGGLSPSLELHATTSEDAWL